MGDASFLDKSIECPEGHSFDNRIKGYSVFYKRDREDMDADAYTASSYEGILRYNKSKYNYIWENGDWICNLNY